MIIYRTRAFEMATVTSFHYEDEEDSLKSTPPSSKVLGSEACCKTASKFFKMTETAAWLLTASTRESSAMQMMHAHYVHRLKSS